MRTKPINPRKIMKKRGQGYYLVTGRMKNVPKGLATEFTELWQFSGLRTRHLKLWCERENFKTLKTRLDNWFTQFDVMDNWNFKLMHYTKVKYLGKDIIKLLKGTKHEP